MMVDDLCFEFKDGFFYIYSFIIFNWKGTKSNAFFFIRMGTAAEKCDDDLQPNIFYAPFYGLPRGYFRTVMP